MDYISGSGLENEGILVILEKKYEYEFQTYCSNSNTQVVRKLPNAYFLLQKDEQVHWIQNQAAMQETFT